jgi:hypothetical protein
MGGGVRGEVLRLSLSPPLPPAPGIPLVGSRAIVAAQGRPGQGDWPAGG